MALHKEESDAGVIQRAAGSYVQLEAIARNHPDANGFRLFQVVERGLTVPVGVGITDDNLPGFAKIGLHFAASVEPVPGATVATLSHVIFRRVRPRHIITLPFHLPYFDPGGELRHEVMLHPHGEDAIVTVMLFSAFGVAIRLPKFRTRKSVRYRQFLDGRPAEIESTAAILLDIRPPSDREWDDYFETSRRRISQIFNYRAHQEINEMALAAARVAHGEMLRTNAMGDFFRYFRAELEKNALPLEDVDDLVRQARWRFEHGQPLVDESAYEIKPRQRA